MSIIRCRVRIDKGRIIKSYKLFNLTIFKIDSGVYKRYFIFGIRVLKFFDKNSKDSICPVWKKYNIENKVHVKPDIIKKIISGGAIKVVSFDIFDTLLYRPVLDPKDIFYLVACKVDKKFGIDFVKLRWDAEKNINKINATLDDIYQYVKKEGNLDDDVIAELISEEKNCEYNILQPRKDIMEVYQEACWQGKKIIAVSDMYLPEEFLEKLLHEKGYENINSIFVSNTYKRRKDDGGLYDVVIEKLDVEPYEICHIGDNYQSDYLMALNYGISAVYYPSIRDIVFSKGSVYNEIWNVQNISNDPYMRVLMGFAIFNTFASHNDLCNDGKVYGDLSRFARLFLAPLLVFIIHSIVNKKDVIGYRKRIFFSSRDGYLPKKVYDIFRNYMEIPESIYLYSGRRVYFSAQSGDMIDYLRNYECSPNYTFENFVRAHFEIDGLAEKIVNCLDENEKEKFLVERDGCVNILKRFEKDIDAYVRKHKENISEYYSRIFFSKNGYSDVVFDCGYSGSISKAIGNIIGKSIDKIYLWESQKNKQLDKQNGTKTFSIFGDLVIKPGRMHILLEELFSPCEGGVLGFENGKPIIEGIDFQKSMVYDLKLVHSEVYKFIKNYCNTFKDYLDSINFFDFAVIFKSYDAIVSKFRTNAEYSLFKNIVFPDPVFLSEELSLSQKIANSIDWNDVFEGTGFTVHEKNELYGNYYNKTSIGIHIHLFNFYLYDEFLSCLAEFPAKFDLIITVNNEENAKIARNVFDTNVIENLNNLIVKVVPNRGRDIAPWLVYTRDEQGQYDLFCHVHGKVSNYIAFGDEWRQYLIQKLLGRKYITNILNVFDKDEVGMVFPEIFEKLKSICIQYEIKQEGEFGEIDIISNIIKKMGVTRPLNRSDIFFSEGTMFWYRTNVLKPLFELGWTLDDFPEEPVDVGGTIMHALERIPTIICREQGKKVLVF